MLDSSSVFWVLPNAISANFRPKVTGKVIPSTLPNVEVDDDDPGNLILRVRNYEKYLFKIV